MSKTTFPKAETKKPKSRKFHLTKEQFEALPTLKQRVAIAKDVLMQLATEKYKATRGEYFAFDQIQVPLKKGAKKAQKAKKFSWMDDADKLDKEEAKNMFFPYNYEAPKSVKAQEYFSRPDVQCHVCAKGAAVCSMVRAINKQDLRNLSASDKRIVKIFGARIWDEMECMFEGFNLIYQDKTGSRVRKHDYADKFYYGTCTWEEAMKETEVKLNNYSRKKTPLEAVMQNIIDNKGYLKTQHGEILK